MRSKRLRAESDRTGSARSIMPPPAAWSPAFSTTRAFAPARSIPKVQRAINLEETLQRRARLQAASQMTITPSGSRIQRGFFSDLFCGCFGCCKDNEEDDTPGENTRLIIDDTSPFDNYFGTVEKKFDEIVESGGTIYRRGNARVAIIDRGGAIQVEGADTDGTEYSGAMQYKIRDDIFDFGGANSTPKSSGLGGLMLHIGLQGKSHLKIVQASNVTGSYGFYEHLGFRNESALTPVDVANLTHNPMARTIEQKENLHLNLGHFQVARDTLLMNLNLKWAKE